MSSRSQTKSLDRDLSQRKNKIYYPRNIQKINNSAERLICHYHNQIEEIFNIYQVNEFDDYFKTDKISGVIQDLPSIFNLDCELENVFRQMSYVSNETLSNYLEFVITTQKLLLGINSKLIKTILCGLLRYCVSLAKYCTSEISFVVNYEKLIQRNLPDISKELKDIAKQLTILKDVTGTTRLVLINGSDIVDSIRKIRAGINKLYYLITEWVDEERSYNINLSDEMKLVKLQIFAIQQRSDVYRNLLNRRQTKLTNLEKHLEILKKNHMILKRKHRRIQRSKQNIEGTLNQLENHATFRDIELAAINRKLNHLEHTKNKSNKRENKYLSMEIQTIKTEQRDLKSKHLKLDDNKLSLIRHKDRLINTEFDMTQKIDLAEKEIVKNELTKSKLLNGLKEDMEEHAQDLQKLKELHPVLNDLKFLYSKKNSPETLRQLHNHGKLILDSKELNLVDKMCERVAKSVPETWRELYLNLPFYPSRSNDQRCNDIEVIDLLSARNDSTPSKQALMALNKWRLFYHNANPGHLIEGLRKSHLNDIAKEMEEWELKYKKRYEEE